MIASADFDGNIVTGFSLEPVCSAIAAVEKGAGREGVLAMRDGDHRIYCGRLVTGEGIEPDASEEFLAAHSGFRSMRR